ncbi:DUF4276 family protein [Spirosoma sp. RP8]|uniref:DUF4276 family protein n=1 Tax=Spirosoma liriopis TaxID=2937440 RepID=A0ABT0HVA9_9BACT|nr:DUF4276 family protein [Spirosoma liriopis]MCK8496136.1 DUF4276 family protein [Spirosoma liriopis]
MNNPAFIVDGFTELKIIQEICPGRPVKRTDLNGKDVTIIAIAKKVSSLIRLLGNRYYPIILLVDKEKREISFEDMAQQLRQALVNEGITDQDIRIGVADRMIENWIVADWEELTGSLENVPEDTDGIHGAGIIKNIKGSYNKTTDGVQLFRSARQVFMYQRSASFRYFINNIDGIPCGYLAFDRA